MYQVNPFKSTKKHVKKMDEKVWDAIQTTDCDW